MTWEKIHHNYILQGEGFLISFLPSTRHADLDIFSAIGGAMGLGTGDSETALVVPDGNPKYRILNGDFRKEYEAVVGKGLDAAIAVYEKNKAARSDWSTDAVIARMREAD
jgi:hypothetical protein